jgi:predicted anti-sigma-YlaC factor YlaD
LKLESFREWIRQIYATRDDELDCDAVFELIPKYVDKEVAGEDPTIDFPQVEQHFKHCSRCRDIYIGVLEAAKLEEQEQAERTASPSLQL